MKKRILRFLNEEEGPTAVEYAVMLAMILLMCIGMIGLLGTNNQALWENNEKGLDAAFNGTLGGS